MATTITKLLFRRGSDTDRTSTTLSMGEPGWVTVKNRLFVGDGTTAGGRAIPLTDERYFEWSSGSNDSTDAKNSDTGFIDDGTEFLTFNKNGLSALMSQHFVPQIPDDPSAGTDMIGDLRIGDGYNFSVGGSITGESLTITPGNCNLVNVICHDITASGTVSITEDLSVADDLEVGDNLTVNGDLLVKGNTVTRDDVSTRDNKIYINVQTTDNTAGLDNGTVSANAAASEAGLYIKHNAASPNDLGYFRVSDYEANLEIKAPEGKELKFDINADSIYTAAGNLTVESGSSRINQDVTSDADVNFTSVTAAVLNGTTITGTTITANTRFHGPLTGDVTGSLAGNADTATTLQTTRTIGGVNFDGSASIVPETVQVEARTNDQWFYPSFVSGTGNRQHYIDNEASLNQLRYNTDSKTLNVRNVEIDSGLTANRIGANRGDVDNPGIYFQGDPNTGFFQNTANENKIRVSIHGDDTGCFGVWTRGGMSTSMYGWVGDVKSNYIECTGRLNVHSGNQSDPSIYFNDSDDNTGLYWVGADKLGITTGGAGRGYFNENGWNGAIRTGANNGIAGAMATSYLNNAVIGSDRSQIANAEFKYTRTWDTLLVAPFRGYYDLDDFSTVNNTYSADAFTGITHYEDLQVREINTSSAWMPGLAFTSDSNTGIWATGSNDASIRFACNGRNVGRINPDGWNGELKAVARDGGLVLETGATATEATFSGTSNTSEHVNITATQNNHNYRMVFGPVNDTSDTYGDLYKDGGGRFYYNPNTGVMQVSSIDIRPYTNTGYQALNITQGQVVVNQHAQNTDFRVEAESGSGEEVEFNPLYAIFVNASHGRVGIGKSPGAVSLDVGGTCKADRFEGDGTNIDLSNHALLGGVGTAVQTSGGEQDITSRFHFSHAAVPLKFTESDQTGGLKDWRFVFDGKQFRIDVDEGSAGDFTSGNLRTPLVIDPVNYNISTNESNLIINNGKDFFLCSDVSNDDDAGDILFWATAASQQKGRIFSYADSNTNSDQRLNFVAGTGTSPHMCIKNDGELLVEGDVTAFHSFSDKRLKKNIKPIDSMQALEKVNSLESVTFTWKDAPDLGSQVGFIAQQVEEIVPEVVTNRQRLDRKSKTGTSEYKHIEYDRLIPMLVESIKVLTAKVEELESRGK